MNLVKKIRGLKQLKRISYLSNRPPHPLGSLDIEEPVVWNAWLQDLSRLSSLSPPPPTGGGAEVVTADDVIYLPVSHYSTTFDDSLLEDFLQIVI
jgi:hypothetical protein